MTVRWPEGQEYGLDDCVYWPRPEADCSGPRMAEIESEAGVIAVCEHHFNHPPA